MRVSRLLSLTLMLALCVIALARPASAGSNDQPPPQVGWTHPNPYNTDTPDRHGRILTGKPFTVGAPVIANIDDNLSNGREVVIGGMDGRIYALRKDGSSLWERLAPGAGCGEPYLYAKPTVGQILGNGVTYVVVGYGPRLLNGCDGGVVVYRGSDGQQLWNFSLKTYHQQVIGDSEAGYGVISGVALADTDGDGQMELAFGGLDRNVYLLNANGTVRWYYQAADTVWSMPLFMNVDADPPLELVVGTDISANPDLNPPTSNGGFMHAFDTAPRNPPRIPFQTGFIWRVAFDQVIYSSPVAADLLPNNPGLEIAVGAGCFFPEGAAVKNGRWVKILNPSNGAVLQTLNAPGCTQSSPAVADIDDDKALEIVIIARGDNNGSDGKTRVVAWDVTNPNPKWQSVPYSPHRPPSDSQGHDPGSDLQSPVIADLDGNGSLEVLAVNFSSVHVLKGMTGEFLTCQNNQCGTKMSLYTWTFQRGTPAVGDLDGDGDLEVVSGSSHWGNTARAHIFAWTNFAGVLKSDPGAQKIYAAPWPELRRTATGNGVFVAPGLTTTIPALKVLAEPGQTRTFRIAIGSADGGPINPSASVADDANGIATVSMDGRTIVLTVAANALGNGTYTARVPVSSPDLPTISINLTLQVTDSVSEIYLPVTAR